MPPASVPSGSSGLPVAERTESGAVVSLDVALTVRTWVATLYRACVIVTSSTVGASRTVGSLPVAVTV